MRSSLGEYRRGFFPARTTRVTDGCADDVKDARLPDCSQTERSPARRRLFLPSPMSAFLLRPGVVLLSFLPCAPLILTLPLPCFGTEATAATVRGHLYATFCGLDRYEIVRWLLMPAFLLFSAINTSAIFTFLSDRGYRADTCLFLAVALLNSALLAVVCAGVRSVWRHVLPSEDRSLQN